METKPTLRDLIIERIFYAIPDELLRRAYMLEEEDLKSMSDLDLLELYEEVLLE